MDTAEKAGLIIELISRRVFGWRMWPLSGIFQVLAYLEKWTGKRSISV
jgi:hypothetical protein